MDTMGDNTAPMVPAQNEFLCFVQQKVDTLPADHIIKLCNDFYKKDEIVTARTLLEGFLPKRLPKRQGSDMQKSTVEDIIKCVLDPNNQLPVFYAVNLSRLPPVDITHCDMSVILQELQALRAEVREMQALRAQINDYSAMKTEIARLQENVESIVVNQQPTHAVSSSGTTQEIGKVASYVEVLKAGKPKPRVQQRPPVIGTSNVNNKVKAITVRRTIDVFVSRLHPTTCDEEIHECVEDIMTDVKDINVECHRLKSKYEHLYTSYHVAVTLDSSIMSKYIDLLQSSDSWPTGVLVRRYFKPKPHNDNE